MQPNKTKAWVDIVMGVIFIALFFSMFFYGISILINHTVSYEVAMGIFIIIIGALGTFEGSMMIKKSVKIINSDRLA